MQKLHSQTLVMHTAQLVESMADYAFLTYVKDRARCQVEGIPPFDCREIGKQAMAEVVAELLLDAIMGINANTGFSYRGVVKMPVIHTEKYQNWRDSGNCGMFTIEEMFDAHCRELPLGPLIEGAIRWYTSEFVNEIMALINNDWYCDRENELVIFTNRELLVKQILNGTVVLPLLAKEDYEFAAEADSFEAIRDEVFQWPYSFVTQNEMKVLHERIPSFILSPEDQDSDEDPTVELYVLKPEVIDRIKKL
ncbi:hypothetical protein PARSHIK_220 [Erwinia phage vB_EamM_Parshik]|uniref:Uncharacterized protein n=1 Tax=Erwinia phage vB_EamM_Huxley TaxID=1883373 RepID=A0A1B2IDG5_9CAUD|nr:hypothetical protein BIZ81_gp064 [Erwinia phage vB_EamM_Huxley]ANZ49301.1 hypothetical protein HUXLEY_219 [Erwinia phage vB_EamM_Huxley]ANZ50129.1 hypothetical protein PARSHIK_220 [Erwinia phage vB_EamM_Parshik]